MTATADANLFSCLRRFAEEAPDRLALIHRGKTLAYGEFRIRVERRAAELRRRGIGKGERIVIFVPMGICLYEILLAVFAVGAVAVFLDAWADPKRLDYAAQLAEAKAYIAVPKAYLLLLRSRALRRIPVRLLPGFGRRRACGGFVPAECSPDDPALITFTTGSTGVPKAARRIRAQRESDSHAPRAPCRRRGGVSGICRRAFRRVQGNARHCRLWFH